MAKRITWKREYTPFVAGGAMLFAGLGIWWFTKPKPVIAPNIEQLVMEYVKVQGGVGYPQIASVSGLEWTRDDHARVGLVSNPLLLPELRLRRVVFSPQYPIDCYPGDTIRSTFIFDYKGGESQYRFEVKMIHWWYGVSYLVRENRTLPHTGEITRMTEVFETQIDINIPMSDVGTAYDAKAIIHHGSVGDIIWDEIIDVFRVLPLGLEFTNLAMQYQKI